MRRCRLRRCAFAAIVTAAAAGCGSAARQPDQPAPVVVAAEPSPASSGPAPTDRSSRYRCEVEVPVRGAAVVGEVKGEGRVDLGDEAWRKACEALRDDHGMDCERDRDDLHVSRAERVTIVNGKTSRSLRIELRPTIRRVRATAGADTTHEEACEKAVDKACEQAPPESECGGEALGCEPDEADASLWRCSPARRPNRPRPPSIFGTPSE